MTQIRVIDIVGPVCVDPEDGALLCQQSYAAFSQGPGVLFDFSGVRTLTSSFLNAAVSCLFVNFSVDTVNERFKWAGLDPTDEKLMRLVLKNAIRFYSSSPEQQEAISEVSSRATEG